MHRNLLKKLRVVLSLVFFSLTVFLFIDFTALFPPRLIHGILYLQFIPSLLNFLILTSFAAGGFIAIMLLTFLYGRIYCSTVCPLGTLQDFFIRVKKWTVRKSSSRFRKPQRTLHYTVLLIVIIPLFFGNIFLLGLMDPYSLSGRIFTGIIRPAWYGANNLLNRLLNELDIYFLYPVTVYRVSVPAVMFAGLFLVSIILLSVYRGRWFCNSLCPVGATLRIISRFSLYRIVVSREQCTACGLCLKECKAECIDVKNGEIDFERCVVCFNCFKACPEKGIGFRNLRFAIDDLPFEKSRRAFLKRMIAGSATIAGIAASKKAMASEEKAVSDWPVTPPGSISLWHYREKCTACHLCVSACPTKVLQPSFLEYGWAGIFQPKMDFHTNFCNYECTLCTEVCPTGAILPLTKEQKKTLQLGVSKFIKNLCVVVEKGTACGACSEHCPTKAVEMVPYLGNLKIPKVEDKICIGCGACEYACPTKPLKSIYVESNRYHRVALKPKKKVEDGVKKSTTPTDDFPF